MEGNAVRQVREVMRPEIHTAGPDELVRQAAQKMRVLNIGFLPICRDGRVVGVLTDRDITLRVTAEGREASRLEIERVMTPWTVCARGDQDIHEAAELLKRHQLRRLPVVDRGGLLIGTLSIGMLVKADLEPLAGDVLQSVVERRPSPRP
jgi:CBS domain-containing protein